MLSYIILYIILYYPIGVYAHLLGEPIFRNQTFQSPSLGVWAPPGQPIFSSLAFRTGLNVGQMGTCLLQETIPRENIPTKLVKE